MLQLTQNPPNILLLIVTQISCKHNIWHNEAQEDTQIVKLSPTQLIRYFQPYSFFDPLV